MKKLSILLDVSLLQGNHRPPELLPIANCLHTQLLVTDCLGCTDTVCSLKIVACDLSSLTHFLLEESIEDRLPLLLQQAIAGQFSVTLFSRRILVENVPDYYSG